MEKKGLEIIIQPEHLFDLFGLHVTNTMVTALLAGAFLMTLGVLVGRRLKEAPGRLQSALELIVGGLLDAMEEILGSRALAKQIFPLVATIFLFVWTANWLEFIPGVGSIKFHSAEHTVPLLRSVNTDLNVTIALAMLSVVMIEIVGFTALGLRTYGKKFFNFSGPLDFFIGLIELISEAARLISFSFRLFGNVFAGEVLIAVMTFFMPVFLPVPFMLFEVFVGILQAAIFAGLTVIFVKVAVAHQEGH
ncbi:MAG: F0F1 ATP synthase subunit A [Candidatus Niyogibacteria bacterium]|nr:F0F1 ATP synthase subunit A [Candidatus Niyogibacteria bacterium]